MELSRILSSPAPPSRPRNPSASPARQSDDRPASLYPLDPSARFQCHPAKENDAESDYGSSSPLHHLLSAQAQPRTNSSTAEEVPHPHRPYWTTARATTPWLPCWQQSPSDVSSAVSFASPIDPSVFGYQVQHSLGASREPLSLPQHFSPPHPPVFDYTAAVNFLDPSPSSSPCSMPPPRKRVRRSSSGSASASLPRKRRRVSGASPSGPSRTAFASSSATGSSSSSSSSSAPSTYSSQPIKSSTAKPHIESIDLSALDDDADLARTLQKQREEAVASQSQDGVPPAGATKLNGLTCTVCLDTPSDLTATVCGHAFCRLCLLNWLKQGEKEHPKRPNCPACRKSIRRHDKNTVIALEIKKKSRGPLKRFDSSKS